MSRIVWRLSYEKFDGESYASPVDLTDFRDIKLSLSIGDGRDSFSFVVSNIDGTYDDHFTPNDKFTIYRKEYDGTDNWTDSNVLMRGSVSNDPLTHSYSKEDVRISGYNFSETLMGALTFIDATNLPIDVALQDSLTNVELFNENFKVGWASTNPSVKYSNGEAFPDCGERFFNKPVKYIIEKYSAGNKTEDGNYYWYVNSNNDLVWDKRRSNSTESFDAETADYSELKVKKDIKDVKNFVIVKGGYDPKSNIIQTRYADYVSIAKNGFKFHIMVDENKTAATVLENDKVQFGVDNMADASYPLTPYWTTQSQTSFNNYVGAFRAYIKEQLEIIGKDYIDYRKYGRVAVDIMVKPSNDLWELGAVIACNIPQMDAVNTAKLMRVENISLGTSQDLYVLKEDVGTI